MHRKEIVPLFVCMAKICLPLGPDMGDLATGDDHKSEPSEKIPETLEFQCRQRPMRVSFHYLGWGFQSWTGYPNSFLIDFVIACAPLPTSVFSYGVCMNHEMPFNAIFYLLTIVQTENRSWYAIRTTVRLFEGLLCGHIVIVYQ